MERETTNVCGSLETHFERILPIIARALEEDIGDGDVTSEAIVPEDQKLTARLIAKSGGVVSGLDVFCWTFHEIDDRLWIETDKQDGDWVENGDRLASIEGRGRSILMAERTALNFLQRLSGIATAANTLQNKIRHTGAVVLDTRKTAPGLRMLDKYAVATGGGKNHRFGLYDMVLIKENHIRAAGSIGEAVRRVRNFDQRNRPIEVEVKNLDELREVLQMSVDRIMLDNMSLTELKEAVRITAGQTALEASGNVRDDTIVPIAETGVDFISVGGLTHSVKALDCSLIIE